MKVSIITAAYNSAGTVAATLQSVARQDHDDIEHIVVDGASTDDTLAVVKANCSRVARVISERDNGVYDAFNKGLRCASGDAIVFLNCGDTYTSDAAVSSAQNALSRNHVQAVFSDVLIVDASDQRRVIRRYSSRRFSPRRMAYGFMPAHPSLFLRREVYDRVGEYNTELRIAADFELCLRVFLKAEATYRYLDEPMVRMPTGGLSNRGWRSKLMITREMLRACEMHHLPTSFAKLCLRFPLKFMEML